MKIQSLSIRNYKCHRLLDRVPFHDFTTLIGENDCGKTAVIDFLEVMLTNKIPHEGDYFKCIDPTSPPDQPREVAAEEISGEIVFSVDGDEEDTLAAYLDEQKTFRLKRVFRPENNALYIHTKRFSDPRFYDYTAMKADDLKAFVEELGFTDQKGFKFKNQDERKAAVKEYIQEHDGDIPATHDWVEVSFKELHNFLPKFIRYNVDDYNNPEILIFKVLKEAFENELYSSDENGYKILRDESLGQVLDRVKERLNEATRQFLKHIQRFNNGIEDISIEPDIDLSSGLRQTPIKIRDRSGVYHYLDSKGYGTKKRMYLAIFEWNKEVLAGIDQNYAIRCYDEPDNNLHIEAQRGLFRTLRSITDNTDGRNQTLLCTHSLFMIDSAPASSINFFRRDGDGSTVVEYLEGAEDQEIQRFIELMCREMGLSNSHIFFERCFIAFEGQSESNFLPLAYKKLYRSSMAEDGLTLVELGGNGAAMNFLKLLMKNKRDLVLLFLDRDSVNMRKGKMLSDDMIRKSGMDPEDYKRFVEEFFAEKIAYIGDKEFEDTFSNDIYVRVLTKARPKNNGFSWTTGDIEAMRRRKKFSDALTKVVAKECRPHYLSKPELATLLGTSIGVEEIPSAVKQLFEKARNIAGIGDMRG